MPIKISVVNSLDKLRMPKDDSSDMDVSSEDEGYIPHSTAASSQTALSNTNSTSQYNESRLTTGTNSTVGQQNLIVTDDEAMPDTESTGSFHTAPSSPIDLTLDDDDNEQQPDLIDQLQIEHDKLMEKLNIINIEEKQLESLLEEKLAKLERIRVRKLELEVRRSIQRNRKAVVIPPKIKGKHKAPIDDNGSDESSPPKKAQAIAHPITGRPDRLAARQRGRMIKGKLRLDSPIPANEPTNDPVIVNQPAQPSYPIPRDEKLGKRNKAHRQRIIKSQIDGFTSVGQMKMFLCDLYDKYLDELELSEEQIAHYKELVKKIGSFDVNGDHFIPAHGSHTRIKQPEKKLMLPREYYGYPERLNFDDLQVDRDKLLDAMDTEVANVPKKVKRIRRILLLQPLGLDPTDFAGIFGPDGQIMYSGLITKYMSLKTLNEFNALYKKSLQPKPRDSESRKSPKEVLEANILASAKIKLKSLPSLSKKIVAKVIEDTRSHYENAQSQQENALIQTRPRSTEPNMLPSNPVTNARQSTPITTISYVPNESSFIREIRPKGQPVALRGPSEQSPAVPPTPQAAPSSIPAEPTLLRLYDSPPPSSAPPAQHPPASTSATATSASLQNQNKHSSFQPYRSALGALGVSQSLTIKKTGILCRAESNGGVCNDKNCPDMHFADFAT